MSDCEQCAALRAEVEKLKRSRDRITIPPEALEAAAKAMWKTDDPSQWELGMARAACLAMLKAWPGVEIEKVFVEEDYLILPLRKDS